MAGLLWLIGGVGIMFTRGKKSKKKQLPVVGGPPAESPPGKNKKKSRFSISRSPSKAQLLETTRAANQTLAETLKRATEAKGTAEGTASRLQSDLTALRQRFNTLETKGQQALAIQSEKEKQIKHLRETLTKTQAELVALKKSTSTKKVTEEKPGKKLHEAEEELTFLKTHSASRIKQLEETIGTLKKQLAAANEANTKAEKQAEESQEHSKTLKELKANHESVIKTLKQTHAKETSRLTKGQQGAERTIHEHEETIARQKTQLTALTEEKTTAEQRARETESQLNAVQETSRQQTRQHEQTVEKLTQAHTKTTGELTQKLASADSAKAEALKLVDKTQSSLENMKKTMQKRDQQDEQAGQDRMRMEVLRLEGHDKEVGELKNTVLENTKQSQVQLNAMKDEIAQLKQAVKASAAKKPEAKQEQQAGEAVEAIRKLKEEHTQKLEALKAENTSKLATLTQENTTQKSTITDLRQQLKESQQPKPAEAKDDEPTEGSSQLEQLKTTVRAQQAEIKQLKQENAVLKDALSNLLKEYRRHVQTSGGNFLLYNQSVKKIKLEVLDNWELARKRTLNGGKAVGETQKAEWKAALSRSRSRKLFLPFLWLVRGLTKNTTWDYKFAAYEKAQGQASSKNPRPRPGV